MDSVKVLENNKSIYKAYLESKQKEYTKYQKCYESLMEFKRLVLTSQSDFHSLNGGQYKKIASVENIKNSLIAEKYAEGMKNRLESGGSKLIGLTYSNLLKRISSQAQDYLKKISECEKYIGLYKTQINSLDRNIAIRKKEEKY